MKHHRAFELLSWIEDVDDPAGAEIGVADGDTASVLLARPDLTLIMVDNWLGSEEQPEVYRVSGDKRASMTCAEQEQAKRNAMMRTEFAQARRVVMHMGSLEAATEIEDGTLDFVFIDADHSYEGCLADVEAWAPKVKPGGLLSGHDYFWIPSVKQAVDEWAEKQGVTVHEGHDSTWFVEMGER